MNLIFEEVLKKVNENYNQLHFEESIFVIEPREYNYEKDYLGLDELDYMILNALLSVRKPSFIINEVNKIDLAILAKKIYHSSSVDNYLSLLLRLDRLNTISYINVNSDERGVTCFSDNENENDFFSNKYSESYSSSFLKRFDIEWGEKAEVKFLMGSSIHSNFIKQQLRNFYKEEFESLNIRYQDLLYFLLMNRAKAYLKKENEISIAASHLRGAMPPQSTYDIKNRAFIIDGLDEVNNTKVLNIDYEESEKGIEINFSPPTLHEINNILGLEDHIEIKDFLPPIPGFLKK